ncbi:hypothetical protein DFP72DRAFT_1130049, partial [Ephemerocybe angulata]
VGARLRTLTQARAYEAVRGRGKATPERTKTLRRVELAKAAVGALTGTEPTSAAIWRSLKSRRTAALTQKYCAFVWRMLHDGQKVGEYWEDKGACSTRKDCDQCNEVESMEHILFECRTSGQETVWKLAEEAWAATGLPWPEITIGTVMGAGLVEIRNENGRVNKGRTRLFKIILSEAAYLIWVLRCEWRIGREQRVHEMHTVTEICARWHLLLNRRIKVDWAITNKTSYGNKALQKSLVMNTWLHLATRYNNAVRADLIGGGVLVGTATARRPPGRNR